jgi:hypothetical protein
VLEGEKYKRERKTIVVSREVKRWGKWRIIKLAKVRKRKYTAAVG